MKLRWYQEQAVSASWEYLCRNRSGSPCVVLPTGSGKTFVVGELCRRVVELGGRALVLAHVKELLQQHVETLKRFLQEDAIGVYSAGLKERRGDADVVVAGIQSVYRSAEELGAFQLVIVDEAHLIPPEGAGRYRSFLDAAKRINPELRLLGLTATPYRLGSGWITRDRARLADEHDSYERLLDDVVYEVDLGDLIAGGYLSDVVSKSSTRAPDFSKVRIQRGDFNEEEVEKLLHRRNVLTSICSEIVELTAERSKVLVFCNRLESAKACGKLLAALDRDHDVAIVDGSTSSDERSEYLRRFRGEKFASNIFGDAHKPLKYICNVGVLTTGFDAPNVDAVAIVRPTKSLALYQQIVGRGLRVCEGKENCLVLDYGGNVERHGPINLSRHALSVDATTPRDKSWQTCAKCRAVVSTEYDLCPHCSRSFATESQRRRVEPTKSEGLTQSSSGQKIVDDGELIVEELDVVRTEYSEHYKRNGGTDAKPTLQITYHCGKFRPPVREWLCPEHAQRWLRAKFESWWQAKSTVAPPTTAALAALWSQHGALATPTKIRTSRKSYEKFPRVEWLQSTPAADFDPTKIVDPDEEFHREFHVDEPPRTRCGECRSFYPNETTDLGFCWRTSREDVSPNAASCRNFEEKILDDDCPF